MPKRRANGEGNIRKRKDGRWEGRYTAGYDANGKAITKNVLGKTQAEVKDKLRTAIEDSKKLDPVKAGSYMLEQWLKLWYSVYVEPQVRYSTREFYHNAIDHHIIPKLGSVKLEKLKMLQIQQFYNELLKSGRVQKKNQPELKEHGLSPRMVQCVHVVLNKALEYAVEEKLILANPAKKCKIPKNTRKEMNILPEALIRPYLSAAKEHGILAPMYLELTTGLRRGELLDLMPANIELSGLEVSLVNAMSREKILKQYLDTVKRDYDYILIDCMPSLGMLTINALAAADSVLIPVQAQYLPAKGLEQLLQTVAKVRRQINPKLRIDGILLTMVDSRTNYAREVSALLRDTYGSKLKVFASDIPQSVRAAEISAEGKSIYAHDPNGKVAAAYRELTREVMKVEKLRQKHKSDLAR